MSNTTAADEFLMWDAMKNNNTTSGKLEEKLLLGLKCVQHYVKTLESDRVQLEQRLEDMSIRHTHSLDELNNAQERVEKCQTIISNLSHAMQRHNELEEKLKITMSTLKAEQELLQRTKTEMVNELERHQQIECKTQKDIDDLERRNIELTTERNQLEHRLSQKEDGFIRVSEELRELTMTHTQFKESASVELQQTQMSNRKQVESMRGKIEDLMVKLREQANNMVSQTDVDALKHQLNEKTRQLSKLQEQVEPPRTRRRRKRRKS